MSNVNFRSLNCDEMASNKWLEAPCEIQEAVIAWQTC